MRLDFHEGMNQMKKKICKNTDRQIVGVIKWTVSVIGRGRAKPTDNTHKEADLHDATQPVP